MSAVEPPLDREYDFTAEDLDRVTRLIGERTGIVLGERKRDLVYGRLAKRVRRLGLRRFADYLRFIEGPEGADELAQMVNALTTNLTRFFREDHHFDHLGAVALPEAMAAAQARGDRRLRLWSAACSSGEEPYSIAMVVDQVLPDRRHWDVRILATDLDSNMIAEGEDGVYRPQDLEGLGEGYREAYLTPTRREDGSPAWAVRPRVKDLVAFRHLNLIGNWPMRRRFDIIFCRNVVIYFDRATQRELFSRLAAILNPGGYLYLGHSESLHGESGFRLEGRTIYRKVGP